MIAIDIDYMKAFNDHAGHRSGDAALKAIAGVIRDTAGDEFTYRVGGEEFPPSDSPRLARF
jgi:diguanylate cyclase (GGDEF)-like protein